MVKEGSSLASISCRMAHGCEGGGFEKLWFRALRLVLRKEV